MMKWKLIKLGEICDIVTGGTPDTSINEYWDNGDIPWLPSGTCQNCIIKSANTFITEEGLANSSAKIMPINTVVIALTGATTGKVGILNIEACANQSVTGILPNDALYYKYIFYYLMYSRNRILEDSYGGAQKHISQGYVKNFKIPQPPMDIQIAISNNLDKVTNLIEVCRNILVKLDLLVKSRFVEMFGEPILNPKGWKMATIGDIVTEVKYGTSRPAVDGGKYAYLRMNNLTYDGYLDLTDLKRIDIPDNEIEKCIVRKGDVLFNRTNSVELVGKTCVFNESEDMVIAGYIIRVRLKSVMLPIVLSSFMNTDALKKKLRTMAKGAVNQANINAQELQAINIYLPPIELQQQFATFVEQTDKSKLAVKQVLEKAGTLKKALMQEYFG